MQPSFAIAALRIIALAGLLLTSRGVLAAQDRELKTSDEGASTSPARPMEGIVVTGSRLRSAEGETMQDVHVYPRERIEQSGRASLSEFLGTLPEVSLNSVESTDISTTVRLRGADRGTALILLNGRRTESVTGSSGQNGYFDLNTIPLSMVERIEILPAGSSAIYGGQALAGVVNIVLRSGFTGYEVNAGYKWADQTDEKVFWGGAGWKKNDLALSMMASYGERGSLEGKDRAITRTGDLRYLGGPNLGTTLLGSPANVSSVSGNLPGLHSSFAAVPRGSTGIGLTPNDFVATQGTQTTASFTQYQSSIFDTRRAGFFAAADYRLSSAVDVFAELLATEYKVNFAFTPPIVQFLSIPASNRYNPFGTTVLVTGLVMGTESLFRNDYRDTFVRPLVGARGTVRKWEWEATAQESRDWGARNQFFNPDTTALNAALASGAFNPFVDGPWASRDVLNGIYGTPTVITFKGDSKIGNAFARGPLYQLPAGSLDAVFGAEYEKSSITRTFEGSRRAKAAFAELRAPLLADSGGREMLAVQAAARYDDYSDFGTKTTWQAGFEFRPTRPLLLRGTHATAFRPPSLFNLYSPIVASSVTVTDPRRNNESVFVASSTGGNPNLDPTTGKSSTLGIVWSPPQAEGLYASLTAWWMQIENTINVPPPQFVVDNEAVYPERVTRAAVAPGSVGPITLIDRTYLNSGAMHENGFDGSIEYRFRTSWGQFIPALAATYMTKFDGASTPGTPSVDRLSRANTDLIWAPRWKGLASLTWNPGHGYSAWLAGRYIGHYVDYTPPHELGDIWYFDTSLSVDVEQALARPRRSLGGLKISLSVTNVANKLPSWSNYFRGYDPMNYDLVGRTWFLRAGMTY